MRGTRTGDGLAGGGTGPMTGSGRTGPIGGVPPGLVARVQRRLAATGAVATDAAGLRAAVAETLVEDGVVLPAANLSAIVRAVGDELTGLGPLAPLLADPTVTDVLVNGPADVWVERGGTMERAAVRFASAAAVAALVQRVQRRLAATGEAGDAAGLRAAVAGALGEDGVRLSEPGLTAVVRAIDDELTGLGPLAPLLADPLVTDVMVNGPTEVWVERAGTMERAAVRFASAAAVAALVQRVVAPLGLRVDESRPWVDARLPGGERFHAVLPPLAPDGPVVTIRTFARRRLELRDLIDRGALDVATARLLEAMVAAGIAIAVSGATGTGKTTLLNMLKRHRCW